MVSESVEWIVKKRQVYHRESNSMRAMGYLRLNVIDEYNNRMNQTDVADQLRGQYRPDVWMRHQKWWWSIFIWALGVAGVNAYKIYTAMWDKENKEKEKQDQAVRWSHAEFIEQLIYDFIFPQQTVLHRDALREDDGDSLRSLSSFGGSTSLQEEDERKWDFSCESGIKEFLENKSAKKITKANIGDGSVFGRRFDGLFHSIIEASANMRCQYCYFIWKHDYDDSQKEDYIYRRVNRHNTLRCLVCNINLCPNCMNEWHGFDMRDTNKLLGV